MFQTLLQLEANTFKCLQLMRISLQYMYIQYYVYTCTRCVRYLLLSCADVIHCPAYFPAASLQIALAVSHAALQTRLVSDPLGQPSTHWLCTSSQQAKYVVWQRPAQAQPFLGQPSMHLMRSEVQSAGPAVTVDAESTNITCQQHKQKQRRH